MQGEIELMKQKIQDAKNKKQELLKQIKQCHDVRKADKQYFNLQESQKACEVYGIDHHLQNLHKEMRKLKASIGHHNGKKDSLTQQHEQNDKII